MFHAGGLPSFSETDTGGRVLKQPASYEKCRFDQCTLMSTLYEERSALAVRGSLSEPQFELIHFEIFTAIDPGLPRVCIHFDKMQSLGRNDKGQQMYLQMILGPLHSQMTILPEVASQ